MDDFKNNYILGVKKPMPMDFTINVPENKHGVENKVTDLNTRKGVNGSTYTFGNVFIDGSSNTIQQIYILPNASGTIALMESLSAVNPLFYDNVTGVFSISQAGVATDGYLSQGDWNTFNNKEEVLSFTSPLERSTNTISLTGLSGFGSPGQVIKTNGTSNGLEWGTSSATPGGSDLNIQFNDNGVFGGSGYLNFDKAPGGWLILSAPQSANSGGYGGTVYINSGDSQGLSGAINTISINTPGTAYIIGDIVTLTAGDGNVTITVASVDGGIINTVAISLGYEGVNYQVNDQLLLDFYGAGDAVFNVDSVDGLGAITGISIVTPGTLYGFDLTNLQVSGGFGTGARVDITTIYTIGAISSVWLNNSGTGYSVGTSNCMGGSGNNYAIINIDAIIADDFSGDVIIKLPTGQNGAKPGNLNIQNLPTSSAGLDPGDIWVDTTGGLNILKIV